MAAARSRGPFLCGAGVDVLAVSCVLHQRQVVVGGESEVGHAAHQAPHVLSVCVKSYLLHATFREDRRHTGAYVHPCFIYSREVRSCTYRHIRVH